MVVVKTFTMPNDIAKKRKRDKRYREKKKLENLEEYRQRRREICKKSYKKKMAEMTIRDKRKYRRKKTIYHRQWTNKKRNEEKATNGDNEIISAEESIFGSTPERQRVSKISLSAKKREKKKRSNKIRLLINQNKSLKRSIWKLRKSCEKAKKQSAGTAGIIDAHLSLLKSIGDEKDRLRKRYTTHLMKKICDSYKMRGLKKHFTVNAKTSINSLNSKKLETKITRSKKVNEDLILEFLERDDNSRATSGKKEVVSRKKQVRQIRYYNFCIQVLLEKFVSENPSINICKSTFYARLKNYRHLKTPAINSREQCLCKQCSNMQLLIDALYQHKVIQTREKDILANKIVCHIEDYNCCHRKCDNCKDFSPVDPSRIDASVVTYYQWEVSKDDNTLTCKKTLDSLVSLVKLFESQLSTFVGHFFRICHQYRELQYVRKNPEPDEVVLHVDFSENYSCKWNAEIQQAHFGNAHRQVVIHQGVLYLKEKEPLSFASVSDDTRKTAEGIGAHIESIIRQIPSIKVLTIVSDSPSSQYRNRYTLYIILFVCKKYGIQKFKWLYSETGHGKGAPDGVGAALKRIADREVAHGTSILNATDFQQVGMKNSKIVVNMIQKVDIDVYSEVLQKSKEYLLPMIGIAKAHHVICHVSVNPYMLYKDLSCHCDHGCDCFESQKWQIINQPVEHLPQSPVKALDRPVEHLPQSPVEALDQPSVEDLDQPPTETLDQPPVKDLVEPPVEAHVEDPNDSYNEVRLLKIYIFNCQLVIFI